MSRRSPEHPLPLWYRLLSFGALVGIIAAVVWLSRSGNALLPASPAGSRPVVELSAQDRKLLESLQGEWLSEDFEARVRERHSVVAANVELGDVFSIHRRDGFFEWCAVNLHEGVTRTIIRLESTGPEREFVVRVHGFPRSSDRWEVRSGANGARLVWTVGRGGSAFSGRRITGTFRRVQTWNADMSYRWLCDGPLGAAALAGAYMDADGRRYVIRGDGSAFWAGSERRYRIAVDTVALDLDELYISDVREKTLCTFGFRYQDGRLELWRPIVIPGEEAETTQYEAQPYLSLTSLTAHSGERQ